MAEGRHVYVLGDAPVIYHVKLDCLAVRQRESYRTGRLGANGVITVGPWWNRYTFLCSPCAACAKDEQQT